MDLENALKKISLNYTPEYFEELRVKNYNYDREYPENFSNWYPHITDFGIFKHANIISNQILTLEETKPLEEEYLDKVDFTSLNKILEPTLSKMEPHRTYSIKNGCFSNKFDFKTCLATKENLAEQLWKINYASALFDTGGFTELVVRELIPYNHNEIPTIYEGMPLREEVRVFYNMDTKEIEYMVDYWDFKYCFANLHNITDRIVFRWFHNDMGNKKRNHKSSQEDIYKYIKQNINTLKFDDNLTGIWSIDFMYVDEVYDVEKYSGLWLIDMARGFRSAYWDINKLKDTTKEKLKMEVEK